MPSLPQSTPRSEFWAGVRTLLPILLGTMPFGLIYGVLALEAGLSPLAALAMSSIVFAGSAQFLGVQLIALQTPLLIMWLATFLLNLRHVLYSASVAPYVQHLSPRWRSLLAYLLTDEAYVVTITHYLNSDTPRRYKQWFFLGAGLMLWSSWQLATAVGIFLAAQVPAAWSLDFAVPLTFIALAFPSVKDRAAAAAALSAGAVAVAAAGWPHKLGLVVGALVGITVGLLVEQWKNE
jgi:4-azaleucine resistance transporter AzlC